MATARPFSYNTGSAIAGTEQVGSLAVGYPTAGFSATGLEWWNGPDEDTGYVIAEPVPGDTQPTPITGVSGSVGFYRSTDLTESSFISISNVVARLSGGGPFSTGSAAKTWLNTNGYWTSFTTIPSGMVLYLDASNPSSYSGSGSTWYDLSGNGNNGTLNSVTYSSNGPDNMYFTGSLSYVSFSSTSLIPTQNDQYTISLWINANSMAGAYGLIGWGNYGSNNQVNAFRILATNGLVNYWWNNDLAVYPSGFRSLQWFNVVAAFNGTTRTIWVNGATAASDTPGSGHAVPNANNLTIGVTNGSEYFPGKIAEVLVYNTGLNFSSVQSIYNTGASKYLSPVLQNLVLYYNPGDLYSYSGSGTSLSDMSGNSLTSTLTNVTFTNPYLNYNGTNATASTADSATLEPGSGDWTVEIWINHSVIAGSSRCVIGKTDGGNAADWGYGIRTNSSGSTYMEVGNGTTSITSPSYTLSTNTWYQIVGVWTNVASNSIALYVNGVSQGSNSHSFASIKNTTHSLYMGSFDGGATFGQWFNGKFGVVRMYNSALTASQISQNFEATRSFYGI